MEPCIPSTVVKTWRKSKEFSFCFYRGKWFCNGNSLWFLHFPVWASFLTIPLEKLPEEISLCEDETLKFVKQDNLQDIWDTGTISRRQFTGSSSQVFELSTMVVELWLPIWSTLWSTCLCRVSLLEKKNLFIKVLFIHYDSNSWREILLKFVGLMVNATTQEIIN